MSNGATVSCRQLLNSSACWVDALFLVCHIGVGEIPLIQMTYTHKDDFAGFVFANPEDVRKGPLGEVCDYQIISAPAGEEAEIGCWLTLATANMVQD